MLQSRDKRIHGARLGYDETNLLIHRIVSRRDDAREVLFGNVWTEETPPRMIGALDSAGFPPDWVFYRGGRFRGGGVCM